MHRPSPFRLTGALIASVVLLMCGCSSLESLQRNADTIAERGGMQRFEIDAGDFRLIGYFRGDVAGETLRVYFEGDGRAWPSRYRPPRNPTPVDPVSLRLAAIDRSPNVLYLARPCQFVSPSPRCDLRWWTSHRYAERVLGAIDDAIDRLRGPRRGHGLTLIGHSGGGVVAALLAARRDDVDALVTVASPLSLRAWTEQLDLSPLAGSVDPVDSATRSAGIAQLHLAGGRDRIVPVAVLHDYIAHLPRGHRASLLVIARADHRCCWQEMWPDVYLTRINPSNRSEIVGRGSGRL